jgi:hypothetical protein
MGFVLHINTGNAAFEEDLPAEVSRLLLVASEKVKEGHEQGNLMDLNGNRVGSFEIQEDAEETTWRQTSCRLCGHDVEGDTAEPNGEWRDRGNGAYCLPYKNRRQEVVIPLKGQRHQPTLP